MHGGELKNMVLKKFLIAGGNSTLLVWQCPENKRRRLIKKYLGKVEQIGFIEEFNGLPSLKMMGNELCINGTLALASQSGNQGKLKTSGLDQEINFKNKNGISYLEFPLPFTRDKNIICFPGIGFIYSNTRKYRGKIALSKLATKYSLPAFGSISSKSNKIRPFVYVKETDSLFEETACGSGSIACSIITKYSKIIQPTGESISVRQRDDIFNVGAKVVNIGEIYD